MITFISLKKNDENCGEKMDKFPSISELKEISNKYHIELFIGSFEGSSLEKTNKFIIHDEFSFNDLFNLISTLGVKIVYITPTSKFNYLESSFLEAAGDKSWSDEMDEWPSEDCDKAEIADIVNLQIKSMNMKIAEIITKNLERAEEDSETAVIYSFSFYFNGILHFYSILNDKLLLELDEQIKKDIQQIEDLVSKRDELEIKINENEEQTKQQRKTEIAEELINDPIFIKLKNNRMRLNYIAEKYHLYQFQSQQILDEVQLLSIKRQQ